MCFIAVIVGVFCCSGGGKPRLLERLLPCNFDCNGSGDLSLRLFILFPSNDCRNLIFNLLAIEKKVFSVWLLV